MATHSNILARKIPETEDSCPSDMTEGHTHTHTTCVLLASCYASLLFSVFASCIWGDFVTRYIYVYNHISF